MNLYLNEILSQKPRIIIPDFGAFIVKQKNPRLIVFNEFLQYNDGELIDYIVNKEKIDKEQAMNRIKKFVDSTNKKLSIGDKVSIEGLGFLEKSSSGKINLTDEKTSKPETSPRAETKKTEESKIKEEKPLEKKETESIAKPVEKKEEKPVIKESEAEKVIEKTEDKPPKTVDLTVDEEKTKKEEEKTEIKEDITPPVSEKKNEIAGKEDLDPLTKAKKLIETAKSGTKEKPVQTAETPVEEKKVVPPAPEKTPEKKEPPVPKQETPKTLSQPQKTGSFTEQKKQFATDNRQTEERKTTSYYSEKPSSQKSRKKNIILWLVIILFVNALIITYFVFTDEINEFIKNQREKEEVIDLAEEEDKEEDTPEESETTQEESEKTVPGQESAEDKIQKELEMMEKQKTQTQVKQQGVRYYVVAGAFSVEENADNLVSELRAKGFNAEKFATIGQKHFVCYGGYSNVNEAKSLLNKVRQQENPAAWIKKY